MDHNNKITELEVNSNKIKLLIEQLKDKIHQKRNENKLLQKLKEIVYDYSHEIVNILQPHITWVG